MKLLDVLKHNLILEISEKVKNQLISKFSGETEDSAEIISDYIETFEKYKNGLPADKRDLLRYSYEELKDLIQSKQSQKGVDEIFKEFKKKEKGIENNSLRKYIKKFLEIQDRLPKEKQNISRYKFLDLVSILDQQYPRLLTSKLTDKFIKENPNMTIPQIHFYVDEYINRIDEVPIETKRADQMTFSELEHLIDALVAKGGKESSIGKVDRSDIELKYDENNLKIFAPKTKDQCIKLKNGRSWCTSREGSSNLYYNYRLESNKTLYYVIDEDKDFDDLNFAVVILVDPRGGTALADGSNSGRYAGSTNISWDEISQKVPKLANLQSIFVPKPLTQDELELIRQVKNVRVGDNPIETFGDVKKTEMWLEINSPQLTDIQFSNLTTDLKKKYIALGMSLSGGMIKQSEPEVVKYYVNKNLEQIRGKRLSNLTDSDVALLNVPILKKLKEELKSKFIKEAQSSDKNKNKVEIQYPSNIFSKFIALYGFDDFIDSLSDDIESFLFVNKSNSELNLNLPESISRFKKLDAISLENCVKELPESLGELKNLNFISLVNNKNLQSLPSSINDLPKLMFVNLMNSSPKLPEGFLDKFSSEDTGSGFIYVKKS